MDDKSDSDSHSSQDTEPHPTYRRQKAAEGVKGLVSPFGERSKTTARSPPAGTSLDVRTVDPGEKAKKSAENPEVKPKKSAELTEAQAKKIAEDTGSESKKALRNQSPTL